jgi:hypothetical protein
MIEIEVIPSSARFPDFRPENPAHSAAREGRT